jgi:hypothetical protein
MASVLLDTSFLISLVHPVRLHHNVARQYYIHMLQNEIPMYLSTIAASEFCVKQPITDLPLKTLHPLQFSVPHGQKAAALFSLLGPRDEGDQRHVVRDDIKIIAQASHESIEFVLTEDKKTLHKYCERLRTAGHIQTRTILLINGFDANAFNMTAQRRLL